MCKNDEVWIKFMKIGEKLGCHQMESRSFSYKGYQFPLCARCTGVFIGEITGIIQIILGYRLSYKRMMTFIIIMGIDWGLQYLKLLPSNNIRRVTTGTLCGIGMTYMYFYIMSSLGGKLLSR